MLCCVVMAFQSNDYSTYSLLILMSNLSVACCCNTLANVYSMCVSRTHTHTKHICPLICTHLDNDSHLMWWERSVSINWMWSIKLSALTNETNSMVTRCYRCFCKLWTNNTHWYTHLMDTSTKFRFQHKMKLIFKELFSI